MEQCNIAPFKNVTILSGHPYFLKAQTVQDGHIPMKDRKYVATFRGTCYDHDYHQRWDMWEAIRAIQDDKLVFECGHHWKNRGIFDCHKAECVPEGYSELFHQSQFAFCPHGDGRWSYRIMETLQHGAIPIMVAEGLSLPFEQVIDWGKISITVVFEFEYYCM